MKKHAYLIIAHNNYYCLKKLLELLDDERNDIYLHIDKKSTDFDFSFFQQVCKKSVVIYPKKRIDVRWGTQSQIRTEMLLFRTAFERGPYHYYHLISGVDLPLKTQEEMHRFFDAKNEIYLCYTTNPTKWDCQRITRYHNVLPDKKLGKRLNGYLYMLQEKLGVDRIKRKGFQICKGGNWASLTNAAVEFLLSNERTIYKMTRFSSCADEVYKQTMLLNHGFQVNPEDWRYMVNTPGSSHPKVFTADDFPVLMAQNKLFARKFDERTDREVIDLVYKSLIGRM